MSIEPGTPAPKPRNKTLVILLVILAILLLCCLCSALSLWVLWTNGDEWFGPLINSLNLY